MYAPPCEQSALDQILAPGASNLRLIKSWRLVAKEEALGGNDLGRACLVICSNGLKCVFNIKVKIDHGICAANGNDDENRVPANRVGKRPVELAVHTATLKAPPRVEFFKTRCLQT